jgi:CheY-like chemotaxis protein
VRRNCKYHRLQIPEEPPIHLEKLAVLLEHLERELPEGFPTLARNSAFAALLRRVEEADASAAFRAQLVRRPLATASDSDLTPARPLGSLTQLRGWRIVCLDDNPDSLAVLVRMLEGLGASVKVYSSPARADREIRRWQPHAVISDITRGDDPSAGFKHVSRLRESGYDGPVIFFTARVTPERRRQAEELGATDIVTTERGVIDALASPPKPMQFGCPHDDFTWIRPSVDTPIPSCPTHGGTLVQLNLKSRLFTLWCQLLDFVPSSDASWYSGGSALLLVTIQQSRQRHKFGQPPRLRMSQVLRMC